VLRFLGGVASALALILASALVLDRLAEARRPGLAALHFAGVGVGIAVSAFGRGLLGGGGDWTAMWRASGAVSLLGVLAVALLVPSGRVDTTARVRRPGRGRAILGCGG
jgi:MFS family permease